MLERSSATDFVTDLTEVRRKFGNGFFNGFNGCLEGSSATDLKDRRGKINSPLPIPNSPLPIPHYQFPIPNSPFPITNSPLPMSNF